MGAHQAAVFKPLLCEIFESTEAHEIHNSRRNPEQRKAIIFGRNDLTLRNSGAGTTHTKPPRSRREAPVERNQTQNMERYLAAGLTSVSGSGRHSMSCSICASRPPHPPPPREPAEDSALIYLAMDGARRRQERARGRELEVERERGREGAQGGGEERERNGDGEGQVVSDIRKVRGPVPVTQEEITERDGDGQQGKWMLAWPFMSATHSNDEDNGNTIRSFVRPSRPNVFTWKTCRRREKRGNDAFKKVSSARGRRHHGFRLPP
nr:unnamed protein product [Digitaria exilis]